MSPTCSFVPLFRITQPIEIITCMLGKYGEVAKWLLLYHDWSSNAGQPERIPPQPFHIEARVAACCGGCEKLTPNGIHQGVPTCHSVADRGSRRRKRLNRRGD